MAPTLLEMATNVDDHTNAGYKIIRAIMFHENKKDSMLYVLVNEQFLLAMAQMGSVIPS